MTRRTMPWRVIGWTQLIALSACQVAHPDSRLQADHSMAFVTEIPQILPADTIAKYRSAMPTFSYRKISEIVADSQTFWYDHESMPPVYQDSVSDTSGCRRNTDGANLINAIPGGRKIFSADGKTFAFPFGHTAGTDRSTNKYIANFMWLPKVDGKRLPIVNRIKSWSVSGLPVKQWRWTYPKGTVFGEMIYVKDPSGKLLLAELRIRERFLAGWSTNVFRPFPTAQSLADAIKTKRPNWESNDKLAALVSHLEGTGPMQSKTLSSAGVFPGLFDQTGGIDTIPDFGDQNLVTELLTTTPFVSSYGQVWRTSGSHRTFAPSTNASFSIVPNNFEAGIIEVRDASCHRCHKDTQHPIRKFNDQAILYGDIWGSDQIFSFHVFDPATCRGSADDNRTMRPIFRSSGLVQTYNPASHPADYYRELAIPE